MEDITEKMETGLNISPVDGGVSKIQDCSEYKE